MLKQEKTLTPSERALWDELWDNRGKAVSRGQLLAVVGYPAGAATRTPVSYTHLTLPTNREV